MTKRHYSVAQRTYANTSGIIGMVRCTYSSSVKTFSSENLFFFSMSDIPNPTIEGGRLPSDLLCKVIFEDEQQEPATPNKPLAVSGRRRSLVSSEPQHVTLIVFGIGMVNRTHLEADIGGLTMEAELKKIHGSFTLKEKMKGGRRIWSLNGILFICIKFLIKNMIAIQLV